jgi:hypothetical protein
VRLIVVTFLTYPIGVEGALAKNKNSIKEAVADAFREQLSKIVRVNQYAPSYLFSQELL